MGTRHVRPKSIIFWCLAAMACQTLGPAPLAVARPEGFYIERLPKGADVTLPLPATTFIPLSERVMLSSTDTPQSLSFKSVAVEAGTVPGEVEVSIFDGNSERVTYLKLKPGQPILYKFTNLSSIYVVPKLPNGDANKFSHVKVQIESDKPLSIAR